MRQRGSRRDTGTRFSERRSEAFDDGWGDQSDRYEPDPETRVVVDTSRQAFATNDSPDIPFTHSINPYRGCEHGCAYCYARPTHEYLGFNAGLDFESVIVVKRNAASLARAEMMKSSWKPTPVSISGVTDPYQPLERRERITRRILEVFRDVRNPIGIITKNAGVCRDLDLLSEMSEWNGTMVLFSITTLDAGLAGRLEPRTSRPLQRLKGMERLAAAGIPVGVMVAPVIPGLNDHEIPSILRSAADAGAEWAGHLLLRLPLAVKPIFLDWLEREEPGRAKKVQAFLKQMKGESMNRSDFGERMKGEGAQATAINTLFEVTSRQLGFQKRPDRLSVEHFRRPAPEGQIELF